MKDKRNRKAMPAPCNISCTVSVDTFNAIEDHVMRKHWTRARLLRYIITKWCKDNRYKIIRNMPRDMQIEAEREEDQD